MKSIYHDVKAVLVAEKINGDNETISTSVVDTAGYEGCAFLIGASKGEVAALTAKARQDTDAAGGTMADLEGTSIAIPTAVATPASGIIDVYQPRERYLQCQVVVPNVTIPIAVQVWALLYGAHSVPVTQTATASEFHQSPAEGTA